MYATHDEKPYSDNNDVVGGGTSTVVYEEAGGSTTVTATDGRQSPSIRITSQSVSQTSRDQLYANYLAKRKASPSPTMLLHDEETDILKSKI
jgi:hypothetical protein